MVLSLFGEQLLLVLLTAWYAIFYVFQGLISGSAELREQAALGLGELVEVTSEKALREFVIPITGYVR